MLQAQRLATGRSFNLLLLLLLIIATGFGPSMSRIMKLIFALSSCAGRVCPISLRRVMHFGVRQVAAFISSAALIFCCSCEKHHLGEDPEVQKEHVDVAGGAEESSSATTETSTSSTATVSPTPVEFFPKTTPSP